MEGGSLRGWEVGGFVDKDVSDVGGVVGWGCGGEEMVVREGVLRMEGDSGGVGEMEEVREEENGWLMVDDGEGRGVMGEEGGGRWWVEKVKGELVVVSFGKGFGVRGGGVVWWSRVGDYVVELGGEVM